MEGIRDSYSTPEGFERLFGKPYMQRKEVMQNFIEVPESQNGFGKPYIERINLKWKNYVKGTKTEQERKSMKLEIPEKMLKNAVLVKFKKHENLKVYFTTGDFLFNPYDCSDTLVYYPIDIEYTIRYGDRVNVKMSNFKEAPYTRIIFSGIYKGLTSNWNPMVIRDGGGLRDIKGKMFIEPIAKESKALKEAREALVESKEMVVRMESVVAGLERLEKA